MKFYIWLDEKEWGPYSKEEIFAKINEGSLLKETLARREDGKKFEPLDDVLNRKSAGLFSVDQIIKQQEANPIPILVPVLPVPTREPVQQAQQLSPRRTRNLACIGIGTAVLLMGALVFVVSNWGRQADLEESGENAIPLTLGDTAASASSTPIVTVSPSATEESKIGAEQKMRPSVATEKQIPPVEADSFVTTPANEPSSPPTTEEDKGIAVNGQNSSDSVTLASSSSRTKVAPEQSEQTLAALPAEKSVSEPEEETASSALDTKTQITNATAELEEVLSTSDEPTRSSSQENALSKSESVANQSGSIRDIFRITSIRVLRKPARDGFGVWKFAYIDGLWLAKEFVPCLEVEIVADQDIQSDALTAKAYFFDKDNQSMGYRIRPSPAGMKGVFVKEHYEMPTILRKGEKSRLFFQLPVATEKAKWKSVVVVGDKYELQTACYPRTESDVKLEYPEKALSRERLPRPRVDGEFMAPLIEHVVKTRNPEMPEITMFLRPPKGVSQGSEIQGVLAVCFLSSVDHLRRQMQQPELPDDYAGLFQYADSRRLAVLAWPSQRLWDPNLNFDELSKEEAQKADRSFDIVANAWTRGVGELATKYGIPRSDFLLWGMSGAAQWAHRLCLRKPEYFAAVYVHVPGSFDAPTPEARNVLWCLTTGEMDGGYVRSQKFVMQCSKMGYPIIYKAIVASGHSANKATTTMGYRLFDIALESKDLREKYFSALKLDPEAYEKNNLPWHPAFQRPPFYGDILNQEVFPAEEKEMIPKNLRVALPTKEIADLWISAK